MDNNYSIADLKASKKSKLYILKVKVVKKINDLSFLIADQTDSIPLSVSKNQHFGNKIKVGASIKLVNPILAKGEVHLQRPPLQCEEVNCINIDDNDISNTSPKSVIDIIQVPKVKVSECILKIVFMSSISPATYSSMQRTVGVKDINAEKMVIQIFGDLSQKLECNKVYQFKNLFVQDYRRAGEKNYRLKTIADTEAIPVENEDIISLFGHIDESDDSMDCTIIGNEPPHFYFSCPLCHRKCAENETKCGRFGCSDKDSRSGPIADFNVKLQVMTCTSDDDFIVHDIFCFKKSFTMLKSDSNQEEGKVFLAQLAEKKVRISYVNANDNSAINATKIYFI